MKHKHTAQSGYAEAGQRGTACTRTKTLKTRMNTQQSSRPNFNPPTHTHTQTQTGRSAKTLNTKRLMWRKEKRGVRRGNSWCPGGESASRREFVGVRKQQLLMRVHINRHRQALCSGWNNISSNNIAPLCRSAGLPLGRSARCCSPGQNSGCTFFSH